VDVDASTPTALVITLDRIVVESTSATAGYQCYRAYIVPPLADFLKWESVVDMTNGWALRMDFTSAGFDTRDPQRQAQGMAYYVGAYAGNRVSDPITGATAPNPNQDAGTPNYELWPHPTSGQTFYTRMRRRGADFVQPTDDLPAQVPASLVISRALGWYAYPFAMANVGHYPQFRGVNWVQAINAAKSAYNEQLLDTRRNDNEQSLQDVWNRGHGLRRGRGGFKGMNQFPIDSNFMQSHLLQF
jgi:hypothetical protein